MNPAVAQVVLLNAKAKMPVRGSAGAAGYDVSASESGIVPARGRLAVGTGIALTAPSGTYARVAPRSGLAVRGIDVAAGVVDADYTGEVKVVLCNHTDAPFHVSVGDRIAQLIFERVELPTLVSVDALTSATDAAGRGAAGFGSTGVA